MIKCNIMVQNSIIQSCNVSLENLPRFIVIWTIKFPVRSEIPEHKQTNRGVYNVYNVMPMQDLLQVHKYIIFITTKNNENNK